MSVRSQRATTSTTYSISLDYKECLSKAKRIHRQDKEFYIYQVGKSYSSVSKLDFNTNDKYSNEPTLEHWVFNNRWVKCK